MSGSTRRGRATRAPASPLGSSAQHGVPHTLIADNAGGHLMQHGLVDLVHRRHRPRRPRAAMSPTRSAPISRRSPPRTMACRSMWRCPRPPSTARSRTACATSRSRSASGEEVTHDRRASATTARSTRVRIAPEGTPAANYAFDVTPARLVTGLITERGVCAGLSRGLAGAVSRSRGLRTRPETREAWMAGPILGSSPRTARTVGDDVRGYWPTRNHASCPHLVRAPRPFLTTGINKGGGDGQGGREAYGHDGSRARTRVT